MQQTEHYRHKLIGSISSGAVSLLLLAYTIVTILGFLSLESPLHPIGEPFFTIMELIILLVVPFMVVIMAAVYISAIENKTFGLIALIFMIIMATITSCNHFVILTMSPEINTGQFPQNSLLFSFKWPSVVYALDILAWDWFFALSMIFAAPVFKGNRLNNSIRLFMFLSGILSLGGLSGVPLGDMQIRNIGIIGYTVTAIITFFLLGIFFRRDNNI
ncbi:MAG: hypothetical protein K9I69_04245 [Ignavibacteriales bacterium]|nr:hypothetical protein [Ignavibacteriales bacterium]MCF8307183.1 hypothetical protein [Ignavibacteriales bacterium]MCF8315188.1 hypothetical protein [Ignavibacteriales bacterium]MCF8438463.1 hypothetical protein [Ignavibacteriales bacterium]